MLDVYQLVGLGALVSMMTEINSVASPAPQFQSCPVDRKEKVGRFTVFSSAVQLCMQKSVQTIELRSRDLGMT